VLTFKQFLSEAAKPSNTVRATPADATKALLIASKALGIDYDELKNDVIGSSRLTLAGKKKDSGDIDIAIPLDGSDPKDIHKKMVDAVGNGHYNSGTKVGTYAIEVGGKLVKLDLMLVANKDFAKWMYHSAEGAESKYPGAVRNIILFTALAHTQEPGKDFVIRGEDGKAVVRASKSVKMDQGMERLFKMAKYNPETGKYAKSLSKVDPKAIEAHLREIGEKIPFSHDPEITDNPDHIVQFVFGKNVKAKDLMTAEAVIKQIHAIKNLNVQRAIIKACKSELARNKLPIPSEL
jgi:hypothetical protein